MKPYYEDDAVTLWHGDALEVLHEMPDASIDAVVTDPPYGIRFMGQAWDGKDIEERTQRGRETSPMPEGVGGPRGGYRSLAAEAGRYEQSLTANQAFGVWCTAWTTECLRVLKPGGHLLTFGGSRTWHRLVAAVEDAGFEIRDSIAWLYGSGFPKSLNVAKAIATGSGRPEDIRRAAMADDYVPSGRGRVNYDHGGGSAMNGSTDPLPLPDSAQPWSGWGTALKPAFEPIVVGRKPLAGTVAANVLAYGTGALNVDGCRVGDEVRHAAFTSLKPASGNRLGAEGTQEARRGTQGDPKEYVGRWPPNVVLDESQADALDEQAPDTGGAGKASGPSLRDATPGTVAYGARGGFDGDPAFYGDRGGASRFFPVFRYEAKAPTSERPKVGGVAHPTVKPLDLMRWLVRLVTPPGGVVLEPFAGSGTTVEACLLEGFRCVAIEREDDYLPLIKQRINRRRNPAVYVEAAGEDQGLFALLDDEGGAA